ncbi:MAG: protein kinase domain-containing protein [Nannocystales bacterium]
MDTLPPTGELSDIEVLSTYGATLDPRPGMVLADRYELVAPLGRGSSGWVWEARHTIIGKSFAIKLLAPRTGSFDDEAAVRMLREAKTLSSLDHPNVIAVTDFGHAQGGTPFIVMELLQGRPLRDVLGDGRLSWGRARVWAVQILEGVEAAHKEGIIHRDLKPANLFITEKSDRIKVLDFGLARAPRPIEGRFDGSPEESSAHLRAMGEVFGTPATMSPEQIGGGVIDARSDLYSLGCVLYEMIAGQPPVQGGLAELLYQHVYVDPPALRGLASPQVPDAVCEMVHRCLHKDPEHRPADITQVREAFDRRTRKRSRTRGPTHAKLGTPDASGSKTRSIGWRTVAGATVAVGALFGLVAAASPGRQAAARSIEVRVPRLNAPAVDVPSLHANLPVVERAKPKFAVQPQTPASTPSRVARKSRPNRPRRPKPAPEPTPESAREPASSAKPPPVAAAQPTPRPRAPAEDRTNPALKNPFSRE